MTAEIGNLDLRQATAADLDGMAEAHRDSIRHLGGGFYAEPIIAEWAGVVSAELYLDAMNRGEVFFIATGTIAAQALVLGFSSDYVIRGTTHGTSAYVRPAAARRRIASRLLTMAESFGRGRGATSIEIASSLGAVDFYRAHGFVDTGRGDVPLPSGFRMPCVFMRKDLS
jgi:ribosomal protein S18 acetylase RimI-like enzyme